MKKLLFLAFVLGSGYCFGQQLVYTPINSAFGGDPFNYTWLLNSANSQNQFENEGAGGLADLGALGNLGGGDLNNPFGSSFDNIPELGTSTDGNLEYEVFESTEGLVINVLDILSGEQTQIIIPD